MPQIGWFEIIIIVILSIVIIGPKDFPIVLKKIGSWVGYIKGYLSKIQKELFQIGGELATEPRMYEKYVSNFPPVTSEMVKELENIIDNIEEKIEIIEDLIEEKVDEIEPQMKEEIVEQGKEIQIEQEDYTAYYVIAIILLIILTIIIRRR